MQMRTPLVSLFVFTLSLAMAGRFADAAEPPVDQARRVLAADSSVGRIALVAEDGRLEWTYPIKDIHDLHLLPNGNVLFQTTWTRVVEIDPSSNEIVWEYDAARAAGAEDRRVQIHAFQRLPDGVTMVAESGTARLVEVDAEGVIQRQIKLQVDHPDAHHDTRLVRKLDDGNYLVAQEGDGVVREYDGAGVVVWEYDVPLFGRKPRGGHSSSAWGNAVFAALRLANGNTLISTGNGHGVIEVTKEKQIVWRLTQNELPGVSLAWVTTLQVRPNGNIVLGNCHAGPENPQIIEITRDKEIVWSYQDFDHFGNSLSNSQVIFTADE